MPKLMALKELRYATRNLRAGDTFDAPENDALVLKAIKAAEDAPAGKFAAAPVPPKGTFKATDLPVAQPPRVHQRETKPEPESAPEPRRYRRRDILPEE